MNKRQTSSRASRSIRVSRDTGTRLIKTISSTCYCRVFTRPNVYSVNNIRRAAGACASTVFAGRRHLPEKCGHDIDHKTVPPLRRTRICNPERTGSAPWTTDNHCPPGHQRRGARARRNAPRRPDRIRRRSGHFFPSSSSQ